MITVQTIVTCTTQSWLAAIHRAHVTTLNLMLNSSYTLESWKQKANIPHKLRFVWYFFAEHCVLNWVIGLYSATCLAHCPFKLFKSQEMMGYKSSSTLHALHLDLKLAIKSQTKRIVTSGSKMLPCISQACLLGPFQGNLMYKGHMLR